MIGCFLVAMSPISSMKYAATFVSDLEECTLTRTTSKADEPELSCWWSNYNFQLAALQIDYICEIPTPGDVRSGLEALPDTLKDAYGEIYKRILD